MDSKTGKGRGKNSMKGRSKKGQAMMEYLMTYGLALFIIVVVIGILVAVVLPMLNPPETCSFTQPGFSCKKVMVQDKANTNTRIVIEVSNEQGGGVHLYRALCTETPIGNVQKSMIEGSTANVNTWKANDVLTTGEPVPPGATYAFKTDTTYKFNCVRQDGTIEQLAVNSNFKGTLVVEYRLDNDVQGAPLRLAMASLSGPVVAE